MNFLDIIKKSLNIDNNNIEVDKNKNTDYNLSLGVLMYLVAISDEKLTEDEKLEIIRILEKRNIDIPNKIFDIFKEKEKNSVDIYSFTTDINPIFNRQEKIKLIEDLFKVACSDNKLSSSEIETIRTISTLFHLSHDEFINAKVKIIDKTGCRI
ncbi:MAG: TerB family tellurite resistance protein [Candidatus Muirbacterium halophilum]|nr:TerB family tellurite resistance protein [Candidatus Muirbacterium halophilum]MCK9477642.1 TerB family tellurite resistance protein [Candidatus Muirbacterium halophilum]